jgi:hypothetical protein
MEHPNLHGKGAAHTPYLLQTRVPHIINCNVILLAVVTAAVAVRVYVRYRYFRIRSDDSKSYYAARPQVRANSWQLFA